MITDTGNPQSRPPSGETNPWRAGRAVMTRHGRASPVGLGLGLLPIAIDATAMPVRHAGLGG